MRMSENIAIDHMARVEAASRQRSEWVEHKRREEEVRRRKEDAGYQLLKVESFKRQMKVLADRSTPFPLPSTWYCH